MNEGESILLQSDQKSAKVASRAYQKQHTPLESSALKPKKLTFVNTSPSRQFSLLETEKKGNNASAIGTNNNYDNSNEAPVGRFSLALHVCMTPRNDTSMACSDEE